MNRFDELVEGYRTQGDKEQLREKLGNTDINLVKQDVLPYVDDAHELDIWSNDYFLHIADMVEIT